MTKTPVRSLASVPVTAPAEPMAAAPPRRESLHVRISAATVERVRQAAFNLRREKQEIADEALREWLQRHGF
jgi:hypothetical protein